MVRQVIEVTPVVDTNAYSANDHLGSIKEIVGAGESTGRVAILESVMILDKAAQSAALTIFFFNALPTVASADNAALNISDAEMSKCVGQVAIAAGDYAATSANSFACKVVGELPLKTGAGGSLWCLMKSGGTPTYGAASDLVLRFSMRQE